MQGVSEVFAVAGSPAVSPKSVAKCIFIRRDVVRRLLNLRHHVRDGVAEPLCDCFGG